MPVMITPPRTRWHGGFFSSGDLPRTGPFFGYPTDVMGSGRAQLDPARHVDYFLMRTMRDAARFENYIPLGADLGLRTAELLNAKAIRLPRMVVVGWSRRQEARDS